MKLDLLGWWDNKCSILEDPFFGEAIRKDQRENNNKLCVDQLWAVQIFFNIKHWRVQCSQNWSERLWFAEILLKFRNMGKGEKEFHYADLCSALPSSTLRQRLPSVEYYALNNRREASIPWNLIRSFLCSWRNLWERECNICQLFLAY